MIEKRLPGDIMAAHEPSQCLCTIFFEHCGKKWKWHRIWEIGLDYVREIFVFEKFLIVRKLKSERRLFQGFELFARRNELK